jgi:DNA-binding transcriptional LysR family regulator
MTASGVSKAISRLEDRLGVRLLNRTTRSVSLTTEGATYFEKCKIILQELEDAESAITNSRLATSGMIRVQLPRVFGCKAIIPALPALIEAHPDLSIDLVLNSQLLDLADNGIDLAVRFGVPPDSRLIAKKLCKVNYFLCASPGYLNSHGRPRTLADLRDHRYLSYSTPRTGRQRELLLTKDGETMNVHLRSAIGLDDVQGLTNAAVAGLGISYLADFMISDLIEEGKLEIVMPDYFHPGPRVYATYLPNRYLLPRVRAFIQFLTKMLPLEPGWHKRTMEHALGLSEHA